MLANYAALLLGAAMLSAADAFSPSSNRASVPSSSASKTGKNMVGPGGAQTHFLRGGGGQAI